METITEIWQGAAPRPFAFSKKAYKRRKKLKEEGFAIRYVYRDGTPIRFGLWNDMDKRFAFGISETSIRAAQRRAFEALGKDAYRWRYEIRVIPENWINPPNRNYT